MHLTNIIYTNRMDEAVAFYEAIGLTRANPGEINAWWNVLTMGDAEVALHWNQDAPLPKPSSRLEMHFTTSDAAELDRLFTTFQEKGLALVGPIETLEGVGRFFVLTDPDGLPVQFNSIEREDSA